MAKADTKKVICSCGQVFEVPKNSIASKCASCRQKTNTANSQARKKKTTDKPPAKPPAKAKK